MRRSWLPLSFTDNRDSNKKYGKLKTWKALKTLYQVNKTMVFLCLLLDLHENDIEQSKYVRSQAMSDMEIM